MLGFLHFLLFQRFSLLKSIQFHLHIVEHLCVLFYMLIKAISIYIFAILPPPDLCRVPNLCLFPEFIRFNPGLRPQKYRILRQIIFCA